MEERQTGGAALSAPRVLIIRFSSIGDIVMAVPVASRIRRAHPDAFIEWAVDERYAEILDTETLVDHVEAMPWKQWKKKRWTPGGFFAPLQNYRRLKEMKFDIGIDLQGHSKTALCLRAVSPKRRLAARNTDVLARLLNPLLPKKYQEGHTVEVNLATLDFLGGFEGDASPIMPSLIEERAAVRNVRKPEKPLATICVGAGHPTKLYPLSGWEEVGRTLLAMGCEVVYVGGPDDPHPIVESATDLVGKLRLRETMAWVAESDIHLAADTGTGHIAAAYGVPVVSVFGPFDPAGFRPYTQNGIMLKKGDDPSLVAPPEIVDAAKRLLGGVLAVPH